MIFQRYTAISVNNIYHPELIEECKPNTNTGYCEYKFHKGVYLHSLKRKLDRSTIEDYWLIRILEEIKWFHFRLILKHASYHSKVSKISASYVFNQDLKQLQLKCIQGSY